jgi:hypothetical protein
MYFSIVETKLKRIYTLYLFYYILYIIASIFILQYLFIDSYGIDNNNNNNNNNDTSAKNIKVIDTIHLDTTLHCIEYNPQNGNMFMTPLK